MSGLVWCLVWSGLVWSGLVWSGLVWSGLVWSGLVWSDGVWHGMAGHGMAWHGKSGRHGMVWHTRYHGMVCFYGFVTSTAGNDTTASSLAAAMAMLALNPEKQAKLRQELTRLEGRVPAAADVEQLQYLDGVCRETLRLYPAATVFARRLSPEVDDVLGGYRVPGNSVLFISPQVRSCCSTPPPPLPPRYPQPSCFPFPSLPLQIESVLLLFHRPVASLLMLLIPDSVAGYGSVTGAVDGP